ncbi:UDP-2,4-diacetamido-2,4,6-trideoxy-beta-L-altropyranose hydrolase [Colwelliaceae bacterium 6441]
MSICFRCDANSAIGYGHFSRCVSLADALYLQGYSCLFIMSNAGNDVRKTLTSSHHQLLNLASKYSIENSGELVNCEYIVAQLQSNNIKSPLLIIDHYQISHQWMMNIKKTIPKVMLLNDSGKPYPDIDLIWDASCADPDEYNVISTTTTLLLGPQYALLRKEFQQSGLETKAALKFPLNKPIQLLIAIGATDPLNTTSKLLTWLTQVPVNITINVLTTSINPHVEQLQKEFHSELINYFIDFDNIAEIMAKQQLIITAAGNMMWEAFSLGVPCAILKTCENQSRNIALVNAVMNDIYLGQENALNKKTLVRTLLHLINNTDNLLLLSQQALKLCDGQGAIRTAEIIAKKLRG